MPSFNPYARHGNKPWKSRCKRDGIEYFLGYFTTSEEATEQERRFAVQYPSARGRYDRLVS